MKPPFPQTVFNTASKATKQTAVATARAVAQQSQETLKTAQAQIGLPSSEKPQNSESRSEVPQVVEQVRSEGADTIDRAAIASKERSMLAELEGRLAQIRARRDQELAAYKEAVQTKMNAAAHETSSQEAPQPQGKIRKAMGKAKKAITSLISNRKQGETKQGSGKG